MAPLQERTQEIISLGRRKRRNWDPDPNSAHYKLYAWWLNHGGSRPATENFCHYWRVVMFWAPLMWLTQPLRTRTCQIILVVVIAAAILAGVILLARLYFDAFATTAVGLVGLVYAMFGLVLAKYLGFHITGEEDMPDWLTDKGYGFIALLVVVWFPLLVAAALVVTVIVAIVSLFDEHEIHLLIFKRRLFRTRGLGWITPFWAFCILGMLYLITTAPITPMSWTILKPVLIVGGICAAIAGVVCSLAYLASKLEDQRNASKAAALEEEKAREAHLEQLLAEWVCAKNTRLLRLLFHAQHPNRRNTDDHFEQWLVRFARWSCYSSVNEILAMRPDELIDRLQWRDLYLLEHVIGDNPFGALYNSYEAQRRLIFGEPEVVARKPRKRRIRGFFRIVGDILALLWAFVLTKKWGICPTVTLPE